MANWELTKFKVEKTNRNTLYFETKIIIPQTYKVITVIYNGNQLIVEGSELKQNYSMYEIKSKLETLLESSLIKELSKHSRSIEYLKGFSLTKISVYQDGTVANLRYVYNNKFLEFGSVLVIPPYKDLKKLCEVPLTVETNAASNVKSFYDLLNAIRASKVRIYADVNDVNEILKYLLHKIGIKYD